MHAGCCGQPREDVGRGSYGIGRRKMFMSQGILTHRKQKLKERDREASVHGTSETVTVTIKLPQIKTAIVVPKRVVAVTKQRTVGGRHHGSDRRRMSSDVGCHSNDKDSWRNRAVCGFKWPHSICRK